MIDNLTEFNTQTEYEAAKFNVLYPNVSLIKDENKILYTKVKPPEPLIYKTTNPNEEVRLVYKQGFCESIIIDGVDIPIDVDNYDVMNYTFTEAGEHEVYIKFKSGLGVLDNIFSNCSNLVSIPEDLFFNNPNVTTFNNCFFKCSNLISIPENLFANNSKVYDFSKCFSFCSSLTSIPEKLFANNLEVIYFNECFSNCSNLAGTTPNGIDSLGNTYELWERAGKEGYRPSNNGVRCFCGCTGLSNYNTIPEN